jgi:N-acetylmuramoyl-L-alanine amidase
MIKFVRHTFIVILFCIAKIASASTPAQITAVSVDTSNGKTQIILTLNQKPRYTAFTLDRPNRAVIDFEATQLRTRLPAVQGALPITKIRSGKRPSQGLRIVADLNASARLSNNLKQTGSTWQLIVTLTSRGQSIPTVDTPSTDAPILPATVEEPVIEIPDRNTKPERIQTPSPEVSPTSKTDPELELEPEATEPTAVPETSKKITIEKSSVTQKNTTPTLNKEDDVELAFQKAAGLLPSKTKTQAEKIISTPPSSSRKTSHSETTFRPPSSKNRTPEKIDTLQKTENTSTKTIDETRISPVPTKKTIATPASSASNNDETILHEEIFPSREKGALPDRYLAKRDVIIVIDPGHGGKDPGAVNPNGAREKDVTLAIAKRLQQLLHQEPGIRAILTRPNDTFIGLRARLNVARQHKADVFVAIHADAFKTPQAYGASVFALSPSGASSEAARWLAEKENTSELGDVKLEDKGAALRSVLLDLSQTATISLSVQLGSHVLSQLGTMTHVRHHSVEQARFMVLKSPDIPSILVETGFISNAEEARRLADPVHQTRIATALKIGLRRHFIQYPPPGTLLAVQHNKSMKHVVGDGETLAQVAKRYEVTPDALRQHNQLTSYRVTTGQILYIPTT